MAFLLFLDVLQGRAEELVLDDGALADAPVLVKDAGRELLSFEANRNAAVFEFVDRDPLLGRARACSVGSKRGTCSACSEG